MDKAKKDAIEAELESFYDNPIPEAMTGDLRWWIVNIACGAVTDDEIMSLVAIRDSLRAEVTRLEAENERMRNAINETLYGPGDWREFEFTENRDVIVPQEILSKWVNILQSALSPSTDENEEADD